MSRRFSVSAAAVRGPLVLLLKASARKTYMPSPPPPAFFLFFLIVTKSFTHQHRQATAAMPAASLTRVAAPPAVPQTALAIPHGPWSSVPLILCFSMSHASLDFYSLHSSIIRNKSSSQQILASL
jgi:hypothetical protein